MLHSMVYNKPFQNGKNDLRRGIDFIGVTCAFVCYDKQGRVLMHKRSQRCRDEQGRWEFGAGSQEFGDTFEQTVRREVQEEYGTNALQLQQIAVGELFRSLDDGTPTHWITTLHAVLVDPEKVTNNEPAKSDDIGWFTFDTLPSPLHSVARQQAEQVRQFYGEWPPRG